MRIFESVFVDGERGELGGGAGVGEGLAGSASEPVSDWVWGVA